MIILNLQMKAFALSTATILISILLPGTIVAPSTITPISLTADAPPTAFQISSSRGLITETSVGALRLGMTVASARKALPGFTLSRTTDGEGVALIAVTKLGVDTARKRGGNTLITLYAGESNPDARINERAVIEFVEVWDAGYRTAAGVHPKMPLPEVEQKYGKFEEITLSEIEAREYATFANQPTGIQLRVMNDNGMAGVYPDGQRKATSYAPSSYVSSISIRRRTKGPQFSSAYTDLKTQCKNPAPAKNEGQHSSLFCKGYGNYRIHIFDSAAALHVNAETLEGKDSIPLATQNLTYDQQGRKIEWRLADGKPFAVILRVFKYSGKGEYPLQEKPTGEALLVKGLHGFEQINYEVDIKSNANPNVKARTLADNGYVNQR